MVPKLSIIVPIYNVEDFIVKCSVSLFNQDYPNIEFIFVNDCTKDNSVNVLSRVILDYPHRKDQIRILNHEVNKGLPIARQTGIEVATGDYIAHCDSDDWVDVELYEKMYDEAVQSGADVVFAPIVDEYVNASSLRKIYDLHKTGKDVVSEWYHKNVAMYSWNKLVKRSIYVENNILPFEGVNMWEDNGLMLRVLYYARKVSFITGPAYHYNHTNMGAMTVGYGRSAVDQMLKCADLLDKFFLEKDDAEMFTKTVNAVKYLAKLNLITTEYKGIREFKQIYPECDEAVHYISLKAFSTKGKIRFLFVKYHLSWLFVTLFKCKNLFTKK